MAKQQQIIIRAWGSIRFSFQSLVVILLTVLVIGAVYLAGQSGHLYEDYHSKTQKCTDDSTSHCDFFSGKWVFDNESYPLYKEKECTFMSDQLACQKFGRKDLNYQNWRWQPHHCDLPRFLSPPLSLILAHPP